jgi:hypothetical protein
MVCRRVQAACEYTVEAVAEGGKLVDLQLGYASDYNASQLNGFFGNISIVGCLLLAMLEVYVRHTN